VVLGALAGSEGGVGAAGTDCAAGRGRGVEHGDCWHLGGAAAGARGDALVEPAAGPGVSHATVARVWREWELQPWRVETFKFSTDPLLEAKVRDIVGLYLNPPDNAIVLCLDEKSQVQALDRTAPILPLRPGLPDKRTHDYVRHSTTTLFAALEVATGKVTDACFERHRYQEFLRFLKHVAKTYPRRQLHMVCDNYGTYKHPTVREWLAKHPRVQLHFTPASGSWLNLEIFFGIITRRAIRRGTFTSVRDLVEAIRAFIAPGRQPVSSSTSRAAVPAGSSSADTMPPGSSQPHSSVMNRCRHSIRTRSWSSRTNARATVCSRTTWCSNRRPSGGPMSTSMSRTQGLP
jgi:hypothetical protein